MKAPSTALLRIFSPIWRTEALHSMRGCLAQQQQQQQRADFSSTSAPQAKKGRNKPDPRITQIRYHLQHPKTPRPLRFSRNRALRHWTIHRAWQLYQHKSRLAHTKSLEKQYNSMASACEALRLIDNQGLTAEERERLDARNSEMQGEQTGKLYRLAMMKKGIWDGVPIEYARIQTDTPSREGWNHGWTR